MSILDELRVLVHEDPRPNVKIAEGAKIHPATMSAFLAGRRGLSIESAERLAKVLGRPLVLAPPRPETKPSRK